MKRKNNNTFITFFKAILIWIIIPLLLFCIWIGGAIFSTPLGGLTTLAYPHSNKEYTHLPKNNLLFKGTKVVGGFLSQEDNLGIIAIQVSKSLSAQPDQALYVKFHIKEKSAKNWYYENTYNVGSIKENNFIIFGFPKIANSKGKTYTFELISVNGDSTNAISVEQGYDAFVTRYIYSKEDITQKKLYMLTPYEKVLSIFAYQQMLLTSSIFILPLIYYLLFVVLYTSRHIAFIVSQILGKRLGLNKKNPITANILIQKYLKKSFLGSLTVTLIVADIFLIQSIYYGIALGLIGFWIVAVIKDKIPMKVSLTLSLVWLLLSELDITFYNYSQEDKTAMWVYFFLVIVVVQIVLSEIKELKKL